MVVVNLSATRWAKSFMGVVLDGVVTDSGSLSSLLGVGRFTLAFNRDQPKINTSSWYVE